MWRVMAEATLTASLKVPTWEAYLEDRAVDSSVAANPQASRTPRHEGRGFWVLTAYGISGLALFGVLVYYFSTYVTR